MIRMICRMTFTLGLACLPLAANKARGDLITFRFEGRVAGVQILVPVGQQSWPEVGAPFRGTYTFDSNAMDTTASPFTGGYSSRDAPSGVKVEVGQFEFEGTGSAVVTAEVLSPPPAHDRYEVVNWLSNMDITSHPELGGVLDHNNFQLRIDGNSQLLDGLELPLTPPSLAHATEATLALYLDSSGNLGPAPYVTINGTLESLTLAPEPSGLVLLVTGAYVWGARRRRSPRRRRARRVVLRHRKDL